LLLCALAPACRRKAAPPSRGFDPSLSGPPEKLTPAEQRKLDALAHRPPPSHFAERHVAPGTLDLYVDEKLRRTIPGKDLETEQPLAKIVGDVGARSVLAHGEGELWISAAELPAFGMRLNRRGAIKLERLEQAEGGGGGGGGGGGRAHELRDVQWLELRTPSSPRLLGEP
jgi:hypothetical protein